MAADVSVMRALADNGGDPRLATENGTTPLMVAAGLARANGESTVTEEGTLNAVKLALALGNDIHAANDAGETALHGAAHIRSDAVVQFLVDQGAAVNVKNKRGETPLMIAERTPQSGGEALTGQRTSTGDLLRKLGAQ
jgi:ankyrin repeat protein